MADTVATVPGAKYNVVDTPTALGKTGGVRQYCDFKERERVWRNYNDFIKKHNATELLNVPETPYSQDRYQVFNRTFFRRDNYTRKVKYYLFGINIFNKHFD